MAKVEEKSLTGHVIPKGRSSQVLIRGLISKGEPYLDIRIQYLDDDDEWQFTQKGVRLHAEMVPDLLTHIKASLDEIDDEVGIKVRERKTKKTSK